MFRTRRDSASRSFCSNKPPQLDDKGGPCGRGLEDHDLRFRFGRNTLKRPAVRVASPAVDGHQTPTDGVIRDPRPAVEIRYGPPFDVGGCPLFPCAPSVTRYPQLRGGVGSNINRSYRTSKPMRVPSDARTRWLVRASDSMHSSSRIAERIARQHRDDQRQTAPLSLRHV